MNLSYNASKYGALTDHNGKVTIEWDVLEDGHDPSFVMSWRENDGPQVVKPANSGFGSTVLGPMVEQALNGKVQLGYPAKGLTWQLRCPSRCNRACSGSLIQFHRGLPVTIACRRVTLARLRISNGSRSRLHHC